jgi:hypothetical protein
MKVLLWSGLFFLYIAITITVKAVNTIPRKNIAYLTRNVKLVLILTNGRLYVARDDDYRMERTS